MVLLTGGGTGIGRAAALAFGGEGARVVIGGLEGPELEATRAELTDQRCLRPRVTGRCEGRSGRDNPTIGIEYVADWLAERFGINERALLELRR